MKDIVIFVNAIRPSTFGALALHEKTTGQHFTPIVLVDENIQSSIEERNAQSRHLHAVRRITADFNSPGSVRRALEPYLNRIFAVTCQYENSIHELRKLAPLLPYLHLPTESSLTWATEKLHMRQLLEAYDPALTPPYINVSDASEATMRAIEDRMTYPVVIKPSGLEGSLLVSLAHNRHELQDAIASTARQMQAAYDKWVKRQTPTMLVEQFMPGEMYSVDTYVSPTGHCTHTPVVHVVTGRNVGFDDFFGYSRLLPSGLSTVDENGARAAAEHACRALGLRAVTAHVELMKTPTGWKIIELGPRIGGYRHDMFMHGYGLNHIVNDILNRGGVEPIIPETLQNHTVLLNLYAHAEGTLRTITGAQSLTSLPSFKSLNQVYQLGEEVAFAKNNGDPILEVMLSHPDKTQVDADISAVEHAISFTVEPVLQQALAHAR